MAKMGYLTGKRLLLTNDDGLLDGGSPKPGILTLYNLAKEFTDDITVVGSLRNNSAMGFAVSIGQEQQLYEYKLPGLERWFCVPDGYALCPLILGLDHIYEGRQEPDVVISGINPGPNLTERNLLHFSGTVAAALQAVSQGQRTRGIAISAGFSAPKPKEIDWGVAQSEALEILKNVDTMGVWHEKDVLNVNVQTINPELISDTHLVSPATRRTVVKMTDLVESHADGSKTVKINPDIRASVVAGTDAHAFHKLRANTISAFRVSTESTIADPWVGHFAREQRRR